MPTAMDIDQVGTKGKCSAKQTPSARRIKRKSTSKPVTPKYRNQKKLKQRSKSKIIKRTTVITHTRTVTKRVKRIIRDHLVEPSVENLTKEFKVRLKGKRFYAWTDDQFVIDTMTKRGWTYLGEPVKDGREEYPHSMYDAKENGLIDTEDCLYWADDDDSKVLQGMKGNHLISSIPNADKTLTKIHQQKMFDQHEWFPKCFTLPKQRQDLFNYIHQHDDTYWIAKPRDSYGGFGMCVFKAGSPDFLNMCDRKTPFVVQRYMTNPYLFAGKYKFHARCYMVVTNIHKPFRAYLWRDAQIQFSTHDFDLTQIEKNFNKYSHITNYKVNNEKKNNKFVIEDKPGIGIGTEWAIKKFFQYMTKTEPKFSEDKFWTDLTIIAREVGKQITSQRKVQRDLSKKVYVSKHFEIYGLDILVDEHCNLSMTEANTQPGLDFTEPVMSNGVFNDNARQANDVTEGIINDTLTLIDADDVQSNFAPWIPLH